MVSVLTLWFWGQQGCLRDESLMTSLYSPTLKLPLVAHCLSSLLLLSLCARKLGAKGQAECDPLKVQVGQPATAVFLAVREVWSQQPPGVPALCSDGPCS